MNITPLHKISSCLQPLQQHSTAQGGSPPSAVATTQHSTGWLTAFSRCNSKAQHSTGWLTAFSRCNSTAQHRVAHRLQPLQQHSTAQHRVAHRLQPLQQLRLNCLVQLGRRLQQGKAYTASMRRVLQKHKECTPKLSSLFLCHAYPSSC